MSSQQISKPNYKALLRRSQMIADLPNEEWRAIKGYDGKYFISSKGRVKSLKRGAPHILA